MSQEEASLLNRLSDAVLAMDEAETVRLSQELLVQKIDPGRGIEAGLVDGMRRAGDLFEREEYFIPELLICSDAMYAGLRVLQPHLPSPPCSTNGVRSKSSRSSSRLWAT